MYFTTHKCSIKLWNWLLKGLNKMGHHSLGHSTIVSRKYESNNGSKSGSAYHHNQWPTWRIHISVLATLALQISNPGSYSGILPLGAPARVLLNQKLQYPTEYFRILIPRDQQARRTKAILAGVTVSIINSRQDYYYICDREEYV